MSEQAILKKFWAAASKVPGVRLFRNNVGQAWTGKRITLSPPFSLTMGGKSRTFDRRAVLILDPVPVNFGLQKGSGDLIGWRSVEITADMVGQTIAQIVSIEVKTPDGKATEEQLHWLKVVDDVGGFAKIIRSEEDAECLK